MMERPLRQGQRRTTWGSALLADEYKYQHSSKPCRYLQVARHPKWHCFMPKNNLSYRFGTINDIDQLQDLGIIAYGQFKSALTPDNWEIFNGNLQDRQKVIDMFKIAKCFVCLRPVGCRFDIMNVD